MRREEVKMDENFEESSAGVPVMVVDTSGNSGVVVRYFPTREIRTYPELGTYREREQGDQGSHSTGVNTDTSDGLPSP